MQYIPLAAVRCSRADRTGCRCFHPARTIPAPQSSTARRRGSWNLHPCSHITGQRSEVKQALMMWNSLNSFPSGWERKLHDYWWNQHCGSVLTSWRRCLHSPPCRSVLWGLLWVSDPQGPGSDPEGYTPPPGAPRSTGQYTLSIWRRIHTWYDERFVGFRSTDHVCLHLQAFYLISSALMTSGVNLPISLCSWFRDPDTLVRVDKGMLPVTCEICVFILPSSCLLTKKDTDIHRNTYF